VAFHAHNKVAELADIVFVSDILDAHCAVSQYLHSAQSSSYRGPFERFCRVLWRDTRLNSHHACSSALYTQSGNSAFWRQIGRRGRFAAAEALGCHAVMTNALYTVCELAK
jgi:hypothetical protein